MPLVTQNLACFIHEAGDPRGECRLRGRFCLRQWLELPSRARVPFGTCAESRVACLRKAVSCRAGTPLPRNSRGMPTSPSD